MAKEAPKVTAKQRFKLKQFIKELEGHKGRGTELVTVYVPKGYDISKIIQHLQDEQGTATNIKSSSTRKNVIDALERMIQHLKLYKKTPPNGLAAFSGNVAEREGQSDVQVWAVEPPIEMNQRLYRCDKEFILEPLREVADDENMYGMVVLDKREGTVALLKGKTIIPLTTTTSAVPGKTKAGGQCLDPDTLVQKANGELAAIKDVRVGDLVLARKPDGSVGPSRVLDHWELRKKGLLQIRTKRPGIELQASKDHTFFKYDGGLQEVAAKDLQAGDWLVLAETFRTDEEETSLKPQMHASTSIPAAGCERIRSRRQQLQLSQAALGEKAGLSQKSISGVELAERKLSFQALNRLCDALGLSLEDIQAKVISTARFPEKIDEDFSQLLGYFLGDGYFDETRIGLCEQREALAHHYAALIQQTFQATPYVRLRKKRNYYSIRANLGVVANHFRETFPEFTDAKTSRIPKSIMRSPVTVRAAFLQGLFDAEGWISSGRVDIGLHNKVLIQQVQGLLLQFGIIASYYTYDNKKNPYSNNVRHVLQISDRESLLRFIDTIGFTAVDKQRMLRSTIEAKSLTSHSRQLLAEGSEVRKLIESASRNLEDYPRVNNFFRDERRMSKAVFTNSVISQTQDKLLQQQLQHLVEQPFVRVQIASIKEIPGEHDVVDIAVEDENFFANGILVHNSAQRFERLRDGAAKDFYRRVGEYVKAEFLHNKELKGILLGGPGRSKEEFLEQGQVPQELKEKVIAIKDLSYTGEFGLQELLERCEDVLAAEDVMQEKVLLQRFFSEMSKDTGLSGYGKDEVMRLIKFGAVDILLLSESLPDKDIAEYEKENENMGGETEIISLETREGSQLDKMGGYAAILRYPVEF